MSVISSVLVDKADKYWRRHEEAPTNIVSLSMIGTVLQISVPVAKTAGYFMGFYHAITRKPKVNKPTKHFMDLVDLIAAIFKILLFLPIFVYIFVIEVYYRVRYRNK